jgi:hypothetical protein
MNEYKSLVELQRPEKNYLAISKVHCHLICHKTITDWLGSTGSFLQEITKDKRDADQYIEANRFSFTIFIVFYGT